MKKSRGLSVAVLTGLTLGLLAVLTIPSSPAYRAEAMNRLPTPAAAAPRDTLSMTTAGAAFFVVGFPPEDWTFTIMLTDTARIQEARDISSGVETEKVRVMGAIVKSPTWYNPSWSYHLDPASIEFFEVAVEVCDAHPLYVEEYLDEVCGAFLPGCVWCPPTSIVVAEVHPFQQLLPVVTTGASPETSEMR